MKELKFIEEILKKKKEKIVDISDRIWEFSELPYDEYNSCRLLTEALEDEGFIINRGVADMPTAFTASFGNGKPVFDRPERVEAFEAPIKETIRDLYRKYWRKCACAAGYPEDAPFNLGLSAPTVTEFRAMLAHESHA